MEIKTITAGYLGNNVYIVYDETKECFIVDPGVALDKIIATIESLSLKPKAIFLTHGHHDHIGVVKDLKEHFEISVYIGLEDGEMLENPAKFSGNQNIGAVADYIAIVDGDEFKIGNMQIKAIATPGHTKGGICFLVDGEMFTGDSIFHENIGRCDLYGGNYHTMLESVKKVSNLECNIYPGHGEFSTMAHERVFNPYFPANVGRY